MTAPTLAAERTALSWRRTAVAAMGTAALFINHAASSGWRASAVAPVAASVVLLAVAGLGYLRNHSLQQGNWDGGARVVAMTTAAIVLVAMVAAVVGLTDPGR